MDSIIQLIQKKDAVNAKNEITSRLEGNIKDLLNQKVEEIKQTQFKFKN